MITEDYVSFETAKLLKENGFDGECRDYYNTEGHFYSEDFKSNWNQDAVGAITLISAPTLQMAIKWLREVHSIHIEIRITNDSMSDSVNVIRYYWVMFNTETGKTKWCDESTVYTVKLFNKSEDAADDAIRRALKKLI